MKLIEKCVYFFLCVTVVTTKGGRATDVTKERSNGCQYLTFTAEENSTTKIDFLYHDPYKEVGFSVELFFSNVIDDFKAVLSDTKNANVTEVSKKHWIISTWRPPKLGRNQTRFSATYKDESVAILSGLIVNGRQVLCGNGDTNVFSTSTIKYQGNRACKPKITNYEHESNINIEEHFHSNALGLILDVFFDADVDSLNQLDSMVYKRVNGRRYTFINHGFVTADQRPIALGFSVAHPNRPPPQIAAIVANNVILCGFAPVIQVTEHDVITTISSKLDLESEQMSSIRSLIWPLIAISGCGILSSVVAGTFAWKLTSHRPGGSRQEPTYAVPQRN